MSNYKKYFKFGIVLILFSPYLMAEEISSKVLLKNSFECGESNSLSNIPIMATIPIKIDFTYNNIFYKIPESSVFLGHTVSNTCNIVWDSVIINKNNLVKKIDIKKIKVITKNNNSKNKNDELLISIF